ncbi:MAG: methyltransferase domain-containing protein [Chitinophagaceae bacterium]
MGNKLPFLNVGCGSSFHKDWTNVDFISTGEGVIAHNLLNGIPFPDNSFDVVYHSHVLEHFSKNDGIKFMSECYRVLKNGGILRIAIPDLEKIIQEYIRLLSELKENENDLYLNASYDWIMIELYDQILRNRSGGYMVEFLKQNPIINEDFVLKRCGYEVKGIIDYFRVQKNNLPGKNHENPSGIAVLLKRNMSRLRTLPNKVRSNMRKKILGKDFQYYYEIGKFRSSGEIHQWMYDAFSIRRLLKGTGFNDPAILTAFESSIPGWEKFNLEMVDGNVRKPDSLFVETTK